MNENMPVGHRDMSPNALTSTSLNRSESSLLSATCGSRGYEYSCFKGGPIAPAGGAGGSIAEPTGSDGGGGGGERELFIATVAT